MLQELAGLHVPATQVERVAKALGSDIAGDERKVGAPEAAQAPTAYLGWMAPACRRARGETAGCGKLADSGTKTHGSILVTCWTAGKRNVVGLPQRDPGSVRFSSEIESAATRDADPFGQRLRRIAACGRYADGPKRVVLGGGVAWIWNLVLYVALIR